MIYFNTYRILWGVRGRQMEWGMQMEKCDGTVNTPACILNNLHKSVPICELEEKIAQFVK